MSKGSVVPPAKYDSVGPPGAFYVADVYFSVGDTLQSGQKYMSIGAVGYEGEIGLIFYQAGPVRITQIAAKGHEITGPEDWLLSWEYIGD